MGKWYILCIYTKGYWSLLMDKQLIYVSIFFLDSTHHLKGNMMFDTISLLLFIHALKSLFPKICK